MNEFKVGDELFFICVSDDEDDFEKHGQFNIFIDKGILDEHPKGWLGVRGKDGYLFEWLEEGAWYKSKNEAIDALISHLQGMKDEN